MVPADYGISASGNIITSFSNFTVYGPPSATAGYGLKVSGDNAQTTIQNVTVQNSGRSGIDLNGLSGTLVDNVTLTGNGGVGLALTDSSNITVSNITTSGNAWAGMAIYTGGGEYTAGSDNVTLSPALSFAEPVKFYIQEHGGVHVTNLHQSYFGFTVQNNTDRPGVIGFYQTLDEAKAIVSLPTPTPSATFITDLSDGSKVVVPGMSIQAAIDAASPGGTVNVTAGTYVLGSAININKDITLNGVGNPLLQVSGTGYRIIMSSAGATLQGFWIEKTDKNGVQNIISLAANDLTIQNNKIWGQYVFGDGEVSRAMELSAGVTNVTISGNVIFSLRQPAYINPGNTGTISNNLVYLTRGWVVDQGNMVFTGNTWGTGTNANIFDIVILAGTNPAYYTDIPALSLANYGAVIEDQRTSPFTLNPVYVDASVSTSGLGTSASPKKTIAEGITRVIPGGTIYVAAGTYKENVIVNKPAEIIGAGQGSTIVMPALSAANPCTGSSLCGGSASNVFLVQANDVKIHDLTVDGDNPALTIRHCARIRRFGCTQWHYKNTNAAYNNLEVYNTTIQNIYLRGIYSTGGTFNFHHNTVTNVQGDGYSIGMFAWGGPGTMANNTVFLCK